MRKMLFCELTEGERVCGKDAFYKWTPRTCPEKSQFTCKEHGESIAGNYVDELRKLGPK